MSDDSKTPKIREAMAALERRLDGQSAEIVGLRREIEALRADAEGKSMRIEELIDQLDRARRESAEALAEIVAAGGINLSQAQPLAEDELRELLAKDPGRRLVCVSGSERLGLRPGEAFDPRSKFASPEQASQHARTGVTFAAAPMA